MRFYVPSRPVRYAMVLTHTLRSRLNDIDVDLTGVERSISDKVEAMSAKIEALETRLAEYEETINGPDNEVVRQAEPADQKPKAKAKAKPRAKSKAKK